MDLFFICWIILLTSTEIIQIRDPKKKDMDPIYCNFM